jgi:hypothetical protein
MHFRKFYAPNMENQTVHGLMNCESHEITSSSRTILVPTLQSTNKSFNILLSGPEEENVTCFNTCTPGLVLLPAVLRLDAGKLMPL